MEFFGMPFISMDLVKPQGEDYQTHSRMRKEKRLNWKLVFQGNLLVGAVLMGKVEGAGVLSNLMRKREDISSIKDRLIAGNYDFVILLPLIAFQGGFFGEPEYHESLPKICDEA